MRQWAFDLFGIFFPSYCPVCGFPLHTMRQVMCLKCESGMPYTRYEKDLSNPVARIFWGRVLLEGATALVRFEKGSRYQPLLHHLKYNGRREIGIFLGRKLGSVLNGTPFAEADYLIPVPLHPSREKERGYNQSELIVRGVSAITGIPLSDRLLVRIQKTGSQTSKSRIARWKNVENVFQLNDELECFENRKLLLIDDVVTTGATLEACARELLKIKGVKVFVATIACA